MKFFDVLRQAGLFPQQGQGGQNPYGLPDEMVRDARMQSISNLGAQIMAMSARQTAGQRAAMMSNFDPSGGYQQNLYNAAQMKLFQRKQDTEDLALQQATDARTQIGAMIKAMPPGRLRDAATYFYTAGDLAKAGELLWTRKKVWNPVTGQEDEVDALGQPIAASAGLSGGPLPVAGGDGSLPPPGPPSASPAAPGGGPAPLPAAPEPVDQLTANWRHLLQDPNLTPQEARLVASQGSDKGARDKYAEIVKNRQEAANKDEDQSQQELQANRTAADTLTKDFAAQTKSYDTIIQNGQLAAHVADQLKTTGSISAADKLATLYQFMKTLDPEGAVRDGDVAMAQSIQSYLSQWGQTIKSAVSGGGNISDGVFLEMATSMARMANEAAGRKELKRIQMVKTAQGRQVPMEMVEPGFGTGGQNMPAPIGLNIPRSVGTPDNRPLPPGSLTPDEEDLVNRHSNRG